MKTRSILVGAYEIKRHYQKNMALGFGVSYLLMLAIVTSILLLYHPAPGPTVIPHPYSGLLPILPPARYPDPTDHGGLIQNKHRGGIPVPVPKDLGESDNDIPTQIDLASMAPNGPITDLEGGVYIDADKVLEAAFPPIDSFVPVDEQPVQVTMVQPQYPELARRAGIECRVIIRALIDKDGTVKRAVVQNPVENDIGFESAAIAAALQSTYRPAINNGLPVAVWITYVVAFKLK